MDLLLNIKNKILILLGYMNRFDLINWLIVSQKLN